MDFEALSKKYLSALEETDRQASHDAMNLIIAEAASNFPRDNMESLQWFSQALKNKDKKWFAAKVLSKVHPVPKSLFEDLVMAALVEPNPSSNKLLIQPCIKTFGKEQVNKVIFKFSQLPEVVSNNGVKKVTYWLGT